jgi:hypothetical protein
MTILAALQPRGAHHQGPQQANEQEMNISITDTVRIIVPEDLRYNLM